jgi:hypothetical protein
VDATVAHHPQSAEAEVEANVAPAGTEFHSAAPSALASWEPMVVAEEHAPYLSTVRSSCHLKCNNPCCYTHAPYL